MSLDTIKCPDVVIPLGTSVSQTIRSDRVYGDAEIIRLFGLNPTDGALTYTIEVTDDPDRLVGTVVTPDWFTDQIGDTPSDNVPPLQGKSRGYNFLSAAKAWRIKASGNVTADRTWHMTKQGDQLAS